MGTCMTVVTTIALCTSCSQANKKSNLMLLISGGRLAVSNILPSVSLGSEQYPLSLVCSKNVV